MAWRAEWNRRAFLETAGFASLLATAFPGALGAETAKRVRAASAFFVPKVYRDLGIRPFINAAGTFTMLSSCLQPREVLQAQEQAAMAHVSISELQAAAGAR